MGLVSRGTLLPLATRTATNTVSGQSSFKAKGIRLFLNITSASGTGGLAVIVNGIDTLGNTMAVSEGGSNITTVRTATYVVYPCPSTSFASCHDFVSSPMPFEWSVTVQHADASNYEYSLSYELYE